MYFASLRSANTLVIALVNVVLPWSICPMVPTLTCGFVRTNRSFAIPPSSYGSTVDLATSRSLRQPASCPHASSLYRQFFLCLPLLPLEEEFLRQVKGNFLVRTEMHRIRRPPLRRGTQIGGISEHLGERHAGRDHPRSCTCRHRFDIATTGIQVPDDIPHKYLWGHHFHVHDRLEQHSARLP